MQVIKDGKLVELNYQLPEVKRFNRKEDLSQRASLIKEFLERLNKEREGTTWKPLTARAVAVKLGHLDTWDIGIFLAKCKEAKSFTGCFWGNLKIK